MAVSEVMQPHIVSVQASLTIREFIACLPTHSHHEEFPVLDRGRLVGAVSVLAATRAPHAKWDTIRVGDIAEKDVLAVPPSTDLSEALRLLMSERHRPILLVTSADGDVKGMVTKTDILRALRSRDEPAETELATSSTI